MTGGTNPADILVDALERIERREHLFAKAHLEGRDGKVNTGACGGCAAQAALADYREAIRAIVNRTAAQAPEPCCIHKSSGQPEPGPGCPCRCHRPRRYWTEAEWKQHEAAHPESQQPAAEPKLADHPFVPCNERDLSRCLFAYGPTTCHFAPSGEWPCGKPRSAHPVKEGR